jgi:hypothetical protein
MALLPKRLLLFLGRHLIERLLCESRLLGAEALGFTSCGVLLAGFTEKLIVRVFRLYVLD